MESSSIFKFWPRNSDVVNKVDAVVNSPFDYDDESDDDDSLFDLNLSSSDDSQSVESPRDVFLTKTPFSMSKPSSPITIFRSTPKLKVFFLGFKKPAKTESSGDSGPELKPTTKTKTGLSNRFEPVFTRDNSLRSKLLIKESYDHEQENEAVVQSVPKYLKMMKPFYSRGSPKAKDSVTPTGSPVNLSPRKLSEGSRTNSFKMVTKSLGKSRSSVAAQPPVSRREELLPEDAIQGAILHCKRSSQLSRSASDPSYEKLKPKAAAFGRIKTDKY